MTPDEIKANLTAFEHVERAGYEAGLAGSPNDNPYKNSHYGFGKGFRNAWQRGYIRGAAALKGLGE